MISGERSKHAQTFVSRTPRFKALRFREREDALDIAEWARANSLLHDLKEGTFKMVLSNDRGELELKHGDWLVSDELGELEVISTDEFYQRYEPLDPNA